MPDFVTCPHGGLKHSLRADGRCPRCANDATAGEPAASPLEGAQAPESGGGSALVTLGMRVAGGVLIANALVTAASMALVKDAGGAATSIHGVVIDLVVGGGLLAGKVRWQKWGFVRAVVGGVIFCALFAVQKDWLSMVFQLTLSGALTLLLLGEPGKPRIATAVALCLPYFLLATLGLASIHGFANPLGPVMQTALGDVLPAPAHLQGEKFGYCLDVPSTRWYLRKPEGARKDNPLADRWLTRPDLDAHVIVIAEEVAPDLVVGQQMLESVVEKDMRATLADFRLEGTEKMGQGNAFHATGRVKGMDLEYYRGVVAHRNQAYQVVAFARPPQFAQNRAELVGLVQSFRAEPCDVTTPAAK